MKFLSALIACLAAGAPSAQACSPYDQTSYFWDSGAVIPEGAVAVDIEVLSNTESIMEPVEARILALRRGDYAGSLVRLTPGVATSCDTMLHQGDRGLVVGLALSSTDEMLVIDPIRPVSRREAGPIRQASPPFVDFGQGLPRGPAER